MITASLLLLSGIAAGAWAGYRVAPRKPVAVRDLATDPLTDAEALQVLAAIFSPELEP